MNPIKIEKAQQHVRAPLHIVGKDNVTIPFESTIHSSDEFNRHFFVCMPVDYAIGVGTFLPNNSVEYHAETSELMLRLMKEKGIKHTTSECTLRGFTCSIANVDPKTATPAEIVKIRRLATGNQLTGITGGLSVQEKEQEKEKDKK